jgi:putative DNA primase/helicase
MQPEAEVVQMPARVRGGYRADDVGNARRLVDRHGHDLRYVFPWSRWLVWDGRRWVADDTGEVERRAKETLDQLLADAIELEGDDRGKVLKHVIASERAPRLRGMIDLARSEPGIAVLPEQLDTNPWLLNAANGTVDLRSGELKPHARDNLITKLAPVTFEATATAPTWQAFLERIVPDRDVHKWLKRFFGYCLTGDTSEQIFPVFHGGGGNGKSTLVKPFQELLGDYAQQAPVETFMERRGESIPNDIARLRGARLVVASETSEGRRLNVALIKQMTGGDRLTGRFMRSEYFEFTPTFKPLLLTNNKPAVSSQDHATWRRVKLVPFNETIADDERILGYDEKLLRELPGILNWAIAGAIAWQVDGLDTPSAIDDATAEYKTESDPIGRFVDEACNRRAGGTTTKADLYNAYERWCHDNGEKPQTQTAVGKRLKQLGVQEHRTKSGRFWVGIELEEVTGDTG